MNKKSVTIWQLEVILRFITTSLSQKGNSMNLLAEIEIQKVLSDMFKKIMTCLLVKIKKLKLNLTI